MVYPHIAHAGLFGKYFVRLKAPIDGVIYKQPWVREVRSAPGGSYKRDYCTQYCGPCVHIGGWYLLDEKPGGVTPEAGFQGSGRP